MYSNLKHKLGGKLTLLKTCDGWCRYNDYIADKFLIRI